MLDREKRKKEKGKRTTESGVIVPKIRRYLLWTAVAIGLVGSFLLPNAVVGYADSRRLDNLIIIEAQSIISSDDPELSLPRRIALAASPNTEVLVLATGQVMEREAAESRAIRELSRFLSNSPFEFDTDECAIEEGAAGFVIDSEDPLLNMITWEFRIVDRNATEATVMIDDETGTLLKLIYRSGSSIIVTDGSAGEDAPGAPGEGMYDTALRLSDMMTEYYGVQVGLGDYQLGGNMAYYMAYMVSGYYAVPLYGVVRTTGFTMNERT